MSETTPEPERAIAFTAEGVVLHVLDAKLLGLKAPVSEDDPTSPPTTVTAPMDIVMTRAWEYVGRYSDVMSTLQAELDHPDSTRLGAAEDRFQMVARMQEVRGQLARLQEIAEIVGVVSMQEMFRPPEE